MPRGIRNITAGSSAPAPQTRADTVRTERRRKPGSVANSGQRLALDDSKLDRENYHYRHVNDTPGRVSALEAQDYDVAPEVGANVNGNSLGTNNTVQAGVMDGKPFNAVLMRKPRWMHEEDQKLKQRPLDEMDEAIRRGNVARQNTELKGTGVYTPDATADNPGGVNIIERA